MDEVEDEDSDYGVQMEVVDGGPFQRPLLAIEKVGEDEEIEIDGEKYSAKSSLRKLREGLKFVVCLNTEAKSKHGRGF